MTVTAATSGSTASTAADQLPQLCVCPLVCFSRQYRPARPLTLLGRPRIDHIDPAGRHSRVPEDVEINTTTATTATTAITALLASSGGHVLVIGRYRDNNTGTTFRYSNNI